jgi:exonuclease VII small subunit
MSRRPETIIKQARKRIEGIRQALGAIEHLCSGTLLKRTKVCGKPGCRCAADPGARHGPYYEWGHMRGGKLVHRSVTAEQAALLEQAIANYRKARKLMQAWEDETEKLIVAEAPRIES